MALKCSLGGKEGTEVVKGHIVRPHRIALNSPELKASKKSYSWLLNVWLGVRRELKSPRSFFMSTIVIPGPSGF